MGNGKYFKIRVLAALSLGILAGAFGFSSEADAAATDVIAQNVYAGDENVKIDLSGKTLDEAYDAVSEYVDSLKSSQFHFNANDVDALATAGDFGVSWNNDGIIKAAFDLGKTGNIIDRYKAHKDLEHEDKVFDIELTADKAAAQAFFENAAGQMDQEAISAGLNKTANGFEVVPGQNGYVVDVNKSAEDIVSFIADGWDRSNYTDANITVTVTEPKGKTEDLQRVKDCLGTFTTDFSTSAAGRAQNVRNGASKINGRVLYPGETFSVYEAVSPFTAENGYELAGSYENGTTVQTYGGGICQVSSTLYNAVIRAELAIEERYCHSMIVTYVKPSMDAAIAGTYKDLKFTNKFDFPIYIEGYTRGMTITFSVWGEETRPANRKVTFESEETSRTEPEIQIKTSDALPVGYVNTDQSAHVGVTAKLWKVVTVDGVVESKTQFNQSTYKPSPKIITVGMSCDDATAIAKMRAAVEAKDEATIRALAASYAAGGNGEIEEKPADEPSDKKPAEKPADEDEEDVEDEEIIEDDEESDEI